MSKHPQMYRNSKFAAYLCVIWSTNYCYIGKIFVFDSIVQFFIGFVVRKQLEITSLILTLLDFEIVLVLKLLTKGKTLNNLFDL